jgi:mannose-1-phosphate guanylyltransferase / mannose-6-phosphate isomerase
VSRTLFPVILSGGSGSRLWPMSRRLLPKQFLPLVSRRTLLQETALRVRDMPGATSPILVGNVEHRFLAAEQLREIDVRPEAQILEPVGRNTAPAVAVAARCALEVASDACLLVLPSDHLVGNVPAFHAAVAAGLPLADEGALVTFAIAPRSPATGYGYIERGDALRGAAHAFRVARFVEKPDLEKAKAYVASGRFYWNSGMFVLSAARYLEELRRLRPDIAAGADAAWAARARDLDFLRLDAEAFSACPSESIDYAVMERTSSAVAVEADIGWSDVGSWSELWEMGDKDGDDNVVHGDVELQDARGCYVRSAGRLVCVLGAGDLIVVETDDAVLVADRSRAQEVKEIVERLDRRARSEHVSHRRVYRPWGYYEQVDAGNRYQVKRIMVKAGAALSLQIHRRRAEHWVVVAGTARVTRGDETFTLSADQSTYIPVETRHRLENPGPEPLYLVEVQSGGYLGEDDIVRLDDDYGRR